MELYSTYIETDKFDEKVITFESKGRFGRKNIKILVKDYEETEICDINKAIQLTNEEKMRPIYKKLNEKIYKKIENIWKY